MESKQELLQSWWARAQELWLEALDIWVAGGWAMIGIALISLIIFSVGLDSYFKLRGKGHHSVPERTWRRWIDRPAERAGRVGRLMDFALSGATLSEVALRFEKLRESESAPFDRDLKAMRICVNAAPLVGLLGTVTGMLATFAALSSGSGGDQTMLLVADGISEALYTTETGLVIALPGLFFQHQVTRQHDSYKAFLAHMESVCTQVLFRQLKAANKAPEMAA